MEDHTIVLGAPANGGIYAIPGQNRRRTHRRGINSETSHEMLISFVVVNKSRARGDVDFLAREVRRHFEAWQDGWGASKFKLKWIAGDLVLTTNNRVLVQKWLEIERSFVEHLVCPELIEMDWPIVLDDDEYEWPHYIAA